MSDQKKSTPLAIVGMGCLFPGARHLGAYWANIKGGVDAITEIPETHWRTEDYYDADPSRPDFTYGKRGSFLSPIDFNPLAYGMPPNALEATDTSQLLGMVAARHALEDAGYGTDREFDRERVSVLLGVTSALELLIPLGARLGHPKWRKALQAAGADEALIDDALARMGESYVPWQENSFPGLLGNVVAGRISKDLNLGGANAVCDAACASSLSALYLAAMELETGRADMVVTGGVDTFNDIFMYMCFSKTPALSPTGNARPFDANADGTILGEGLGTFVVKRLDDAERDGDQVYAVIRGLGASSDGKGDAIYAPTPAGQMKALQRAYAQAGVDPQTIELIEAHGTGTKAGDAAEVKSLTGVFGEAEDGPWCAVGSVKSQIGHTKACAGAAGLMKAVLALHNKVLPPTIKVDEPAEILRRAASPFYVNTVKRPWLPKTEHPRRAGVSAFGFGGSNFHCLVEEHGAEKALPDWDGDIEIIALSGADRGAIKSALRALPGSGSWEDLCEAAAESRAKFSAGDACRLVLVVHEGDAIAALAEKAAAQLDKDDATWRIPGSAFFSSLPVDGKCAFVFPGQGAQYVGMLRDLVCQFPEALDVLSKMEAVLPKAAVAEAVYPKPAFDAAGKQAQEAALRATEVAQPALGAVSIAALRVLHRFGVQADAAAGHSYGELCALHAAGRLDTAELFRFSRLRGELMAQGGGDRGGMLAVRAPLAEVEAVIAEEKLDLVLANKNAPEQAVLSGGKEEIARAAEILKARKIKCVALDVAAAFHSKWVAEAEGPFRKALDDAAFAAGEGTVYANRTGAAYPVDAAAARDLLASQLANPVEFVKEIEALYADGVRCFVEVGPGARMSGLIKSILGDRAYTTVAVDAAAGKKSGILDLALLLAQLAAEGRDVDLAPWNVGRVPDRCTRDARGAKFTVPICGANYVTPRPERPATPKREMAAPAPAAGNGNGHGKQPAAHGGDVNAIAAALRSSQQNMTALQQLQAQSAALHQQFLQGQQEAVQALQRLLSQQQQLLGNGNGGTTPQMPPPPPMPDFASMMPPVAAPQSNVPPPAPTPQPTPEASVAPAESVEANPQVERALLETVAEKTGYPVEMLELDMALDADLGIDSIKRVEIFSTLQERLPELPPMGPQELGTLHTLREVVAYMGQGTSTAAAPAPVAAASSEVERALLETVAEKTGYPVEMLDLDMALDADLGIDSIKRVEIFSTLQERLPELPPMGPQELGTLHTLREVVAYMGQGTATAPAPVAAPVAAASEAVERALLETVAEKTGYPVEMLELDMALDADLGIDSIKRVEIFSTLQERLPELPPMGPQELSTLHTLREVVAYMGQGSTAAPKAPAEAADAPPRENDSIGGAVRRLVLMSEALPEGTARTLPQGPVWVVGNDSLADALRGAGVAAESKSLPLAGVPGLLGGLVICAPDETDDAFLRDAFTAMQQCGAALRAGKGLLAVVTRMDGQFGLSRAANIDVCAGGLAGMVKTAAREWPEVTCRVLDCARDSSDANKIAAELLAEGPEECGLSAEGRIGLALRESPLPEGDTKPFAPGDVVVISGGARGVTAAVACALAEACQPVLVLLGRSSLPGEEPAWARSVSDEAQLKRGLMEASGAKLSPKEVQSAYDRLIAEREIRETLTRIDAAGAKAYYQSVDVRDAAALRAEVEEIRSQHGPVRGVIHGAGVLADRRIEDKTPEQIDRVYGTKVEGLRALLQVCGGDSLKHLVLFSSSTARYGRVGQVDYAMANEVLNKMACREAGARASCRVVSVNWGPWAGGMVTHALAKVFEAEGVGLIGIAAGAQYLLREMCAGTDAPVEVVVLGGDGAAGPAAKPEPKAAESDAMAQAYALELDVARCPFLESHVINGKAVLPTAVIMEWLAAGALHANPGLKFHGMDDLRIAKGVILEPGECRSLRCMTGKAEAKGGVLSVRCELRSTPEEKELLHASATVILGAEALAMESPEVGTAAGAMQPGAAHYDNGDLFHGTHFQGLREIGDLTAEAFGAVSDAAPAPKEWYASPLRGAWSADPLALDVAFQAMIVWCIAQHGAPSLPSRLGAYRQYKKFPREGVRLNLSVTKASKRKAEAVIEFVDGGGELVARMRAYECTLLASLRDAFAKNTLPQESAR